MATVTIMCNDTGDRIRAHAFPSSDPRGATICIDARAVVGDLTSIYLTVVQAQRLYEELEAALRRAREIEIAGKFKTED